MGDRHHVVCARTALPRKQHRALGARCRALTGVAAPVAAGRRGGGAAGRRGGGRNSRGQEFRAPMGPTEARPRRVDGEQDGTACSRRRPAPAADSRPGTTNREHPDGVSPQEGGRVRSRSAGAAPSSVAHSSNARTPSVGSDSTWDLRRRPSADLPCTPGPAPARMTADTRTVRGVVLWLDACSPGCPRSRPRHAVAHVVPAAGGVTATGRRGRRPGTRPGGSSVLCWVQAASTDEAPTG